MRKRLLMIAFHYPPCHGSSGLQRTLAFTRYLGEHGWDPALLTVTPNAYETTSDSELHKIPKGMTVKRAFAVDAARQLAILGRYPSRFAVPDRWVNWRYHGARVALRMIRRIRPDAIWSTFPIATAHLIAARVAARTGVPWVADMRDPMVEFDPYTGLEFPEDPAVRESRLHVESLVMQHSRRVVFCTSGARKICVERYGSDVDGKFAIVPNGYDESSFAAVEDRMKPESGIDSRFTLLHSGTVYPGSDRGPEGLFQALRTLRVENALPSGFRLVFRAAGHTAYLESLVREHDLASIVELQPQVTYSVALEEMLRSAALLVIQGPSSNPAIPAKLYEYFRARRPLFGLVHPDGDTAELMQALGAGVTAAPDDPQAITVALKMLFAGVRDGERLNVSDTDLLKFSRASQTGELAAVLNSL